MTSDTRFGTWEAAVTWLRDQPDRRQLVLDAFYDDPLMAAADRYHPRREWQTLSPLLLRPTRAALYHVISKEADLGQFIDQHPLHHLYGGEHAFLLQRYVGALNGARFSSVVVLPPLKSPINLFPHTIDSLRDVVVEKLSEKLPARRLLRVALGWDRFFKMMLSVMERFANRPGR